MEESSPQNTDEHKPPSHPNHVWPMMAGVAMAALAAGMLGMWWILTHRTAPEPVVRKFQFRISGQVPSSHVSTIAPDGRTIAYIADGRLWLRALDALEPRVITDSEGAALPFWAPGSDTVGYFNVVEGTIHVVPVRADTSALWCRLPTRGVLGGATWSASGAILFSQGPFGLFAVTRRGAKPERLLDANAAGSDAGFYAPHFLPDGRSFVFSVWKKDGAWRLSAFKDGVQTVLMEAAPGELITAPVYAPTGHLLYNRVVRGHQSIWAAPFSWRDLRITGPPFLVASDAGWPSVSSKHTLVYSTIRRMSQQQLIWMDREGKMLGVIGPPHEQIATPMLSPDGDRVAVSALAQGNWDIWLHAVYTGETTRLTFDEAVDTHPAWSPDGDRVAFSVAQSDSAMIVIKIAGESGERQTLVAGPQDEFCPAWSRDGYYMAYQSMDEDTGARDLWYVSLKEPGPPVRFTETPHDEALPQFSPNGRYIAYQSNETGTWEVYVARFPEGDHKQQVSFNGGAQPRWSYWSEELFYIHNDALMAVPVQTEPQFIIRRGSTRLFGHPALERDPTRLAYDVTDDGQRFVLVQDGVEVTTSLITVVEHWEKEFEGTE